MCENLSSQEIHWKNKDIYLTIQIRNMKFHCPPFATYCEGAILFRIVYYKIQYGKYYM